MKNCTQRTHIFSSFNSKYAATIYLLNTAWFAQAKMKPHHESMRILHFLSLSTQSHAYCTSKHFIRSNYTANTLQNKLKIVLQFHLTVYRILFCDSYQLSIRY